MTRDVQAVDLSIVVCAYNMDRELPRTLETLSRGYQREVEDLEYEIIVLDNGSWPPVDEALLCSIAPNTRVVRPSDPKPSPAAAINAVMNQTNGKMLGLWIDGARMASPGLIARARDALRCDPDKVVGTLAFHLGPDMHMNATQHGYDQHVEDDLLARVPWQTDGYQLFEISVLAGSSAAGWFGCLAESNAVFMSRTLWSRIGGLEEAFASPGGGYVNLDFWKRAVRVCEERPWTLLGEATFHQVHGGAATEGSAELRKVMREEYAAIRGGRFTLPRYVPRLLGTLSPDLAARGAARQKSPHRRIHSVFDRQFASSLPGTVLEAVQGGTMRQRYKGRRLCKNPFDLALYLHVLQALRPETIIEVGSLDGGSAVWLRDQCRALGLHTSVLSIDRSPPDFGDQEGIRGIVGDAGDPFGTFPSDVFAEARHPWLVIEDSAHTYESVVAVLTYFDQFVRSRDYVVVEDGIVADLPGEAFARYADGPNRAVAEFLLRQGNRYEIDRELCDRFGFNATYCPNAWLRRV